MIRLIYMRPLAGRSLQRSPLRPTPGGVEERRGDVGFPGVVGAAPLRRPGYEKSTPTGVVPSSDGSRSLIRRVGRRGRGDRVSDGSDGRVPDRTAQSPIGRGGRRSGSTPEGCLFRSPGVEARSADDPGAPAIRLIYMRPLAGRSLLRSPLRPTPSGVEERRGDVGYPGSSGLTPLRHPGYEKSTPIGVVPSR